MAKFGKPELWQASSCLFCLAVAWARLDDLGSAELSGGRVTGPLFLMAESGSFLFLLAMILTLFYRRTAATMALTGTLLSLPLYLYFAAPGPFRRVFKGEYTVPLQTNFVWDSWAISGITSLLVAILVCLRSLSAVDSKIEPMPENGENL
jgi:Na+(H+)/acetate symporter ActP